MIDVIAFNNKAVGECENCGCRFSYGEEDIEGCELYAGSQLKEIIHYVKCPTCGTQHKVKKGVIYK